MKITEHTIAVWGIASPPRITEWIEEALRECVEAAALDFLTRLADTDPAARNALGLYVTADGSIVELPNAARLVALYATEPTANVEPGECF